MERWRRIGELARAAGVATSTVRYYERRGLIEPDGRERSGYRVYAPGTLERLRFIRSAQASGLTLGDITTLLALREGAELPREEVRAMLASRLDDVRQKMDELRSVRGVLEQSLDACRRAGENECCPVVQRLSADAVDHANDPAPSEKTIKRSVGTGNPNKKDQNRP